MLKKETGILLEFQHLKQLVLFLFLLKSDEEPLIILYWRNAKK